VKMLDEHEVSLYIFDNASTDDTEAVVKKWMVDYALVKYIKHEKNMGPVYNVWSAMSTVEADYVWPIGDSMCISESCLKVALSKIDDGVDAIVYNLPGMNKTDEGFITDKNNVLLKLRDVLSCLGTTVFSRKIIRKFDFKKFSFSWYPQTCCLLQGVASTSFVLYWAKNNSVTSLIEAAKLKKGWYNSKNAIDIGILNWVDTFMSLDYTEGIKKTGAINTWIFNWRRVLVMRSHGAINLVMVLRNFKKIWLAAPKNTMGLPVMILSCIIPRQIVGLCIDIFRRAKNIDAH